jgi:hypothetical protein
MAYHPEFLANLYNWVEQQKKLLELIKQSLENLKDADRLTLLTASRTACYHISRTIKGFDNWLNNPAITTVMPKEMLKEIQEKLWDIMMKIIEFDIKHTSQFLDYITKEKITAIPSLLIPKEEEERTSTPPYSL